jgi:hypothetical protein
MTEGKRVIKRDNSCKVAPISRGAWSRGTATQPAKGGVNLKRDAEGVR